MEKIVYVSEGIVGMEDNDFLSPDGMEEYKAGFVWF